MSATMTVLSEVLLDTTTASVTLSDISQDYDTLLILISSRSTATSQVWGDIEVYPNNVSTGRSYKILYTNGSSVQQGTASQITAFCASNAATAGSYGMSQITVTDYSSTSVYKTFLIQSFIESNSTSGLIATLSGTWSNTAAVTSLVLTAVSGSFLAGSRFTVYGVSESVAGVSATGGTVTTVDGYRYHTFTSSGSFVVSEPGSVEYLVVAGGGAGGNSFYSGGGGGGAGGLLSGAISVSAQTYAVTVGAGGAGATPNGGSGNNSSIAAAVVSTGGGGGGGGNANAGASGGSGGGGAGSQSGAAGGSGTPGQGNAGGSGIGSSSDPNPIAGGGGGGAAAVGANAAGTSGGNGGNGLSVWGSAYGGGGGGGKRLSGTAGTGGSGGGGAGNAGGGNGTAGTANTGGGGGGAGGSDGVTRVGAAGGSGIVIIRYPVNQ